MDHESARASFTCYYDELLSEDRLRELEEHLAECSQCRAEWEGFRKTVAGIAGLSIAAPSEEFAKNVTREIKNRKIRRFWTRQNFLIFKTAILSFILIALFVLFYLVYIFMFSQPQKTVTEPGATSQERHGVRVIGPVKADFPEKEKEKEKKKEKK